MITKRFFAAVIAASLMLGGCGPLVEGVRFVGQAQAQIADAQITPEQVIIASNSFDAVQATAENYLRLKRCDGMNGPICRDSRYTKTIIATVKAGRVARDDLQQFVRDNPGKLADVGLYNALMSSVATIKGMIKAYSDAKGG